MDFKTKQSLEITACRVRLGIIESTFRAKSGHPGGSLSSADVLTYLYFKVLNIDPSNPKFEDRDRFVLSKGHAAPALYATLAQRGFFEFSLIKELRQLGSILQGHPNMNTTPGVDMSTGSLGQGTSASAGMAIGAKIKGSDFKVYAILGDGEIEEGQVWEACLFSSHYKLDNLCFIVDLNGLQIDGKITDVAGLDNVKQKFEAFGFEAFECDGHDFDELEKVFNECDKVKGKPSVIILNTIKGKGVSFMENEVDWHGKAPNEEEYNIAINELKEKLESLGGGKWEL